MPHTSNAALSGPTGPNATSVKGNSVGAVQYETPGKGAEKPVNPRTLAQVLDSDLVPHEDAAAALRVEPKRLLGLMLRNGVGDPIGGQAEDGRIYVYGWSLKGLRAAVTDTEAP